MAILFSDWGTMLENPAVLFGADETLVLTGQSFIQARTKEHHWTLEHDWGTCEPQKSSSMTYFILLKCNKLVTFQNDNVYRGINNILLQYYM